MLGEITKTGVKGNCFLLSEGDIMLHMSIDRPKGKWSALIESVGRMKLDRTPTPIAQDPAYQERIPEISKLYKNVEYWHGSGRYKYSSDGELEDILGGIIQKGGLVPHEDDWDKKHGKIHSISVAHSRMYGRLYAGMYCPAATRIRNELGTRELWGYYFFGTSGVVGVREHFWSLLGALVKRVPRHEVVIPNFKQKTKDWGNKVSVQEHSFAEIFLYGTDIAENYPVLIGIKKDVIDPIGGSKFINLHEKRSTESVTMDKISHLEVPLANVKETVQILRESGFSDLPVLPIEYGEEYCRQFSFQELTNGKPLVKDSASAH